MTDLKSLPDEYWRKKLTSEQYQACRLKGTEPPFSGKYYHHNEKGVYQCVACGRPLFSSETKFDSGSGWPSFYNPVEKDAVGLNDDQTFSMRRTEVICENCGAHLGHVFDDGPAPTGKRYCINSIALKFTPTDRKTNI